MDPQKPPLDKQHLTALLRDTAKLLALYGANPFQIRHYNDAALQIDRLNTLENLYSNPSISPSTLKFVKEIYKTGTLQRWEELNAKTPEGIREMMSIRGIGPKKVGALWQALGIQDIKALQLACEEDAIAQLPGFGKKTQALIQKNLLFKAMQAGKFHYATALPHATALLQELQMAFPECLSEIAGELRRNMEVIQSVDIVVGTSSPDAIIEWIEKHSLLQRELSTSTDFTWLGQWIALQLPLRVLCCAPDSFYKELMLLTGSQEHLALTLDNGQSLSSIVAQLHAPVNEEEIYKKVGLTPIPPELREGQIEFEWARNRKSPRLLEYNDLRGVLHNHTTYSDGKDTLEAMARYCQDNGYEYIGITDHSQQASYAGGLRPSEIVQQHREIDQLNERLAPFKIFKGIEADILTNGDLDYSSEILSSFDFVIASVHAGMDMDIKTATDRVIKAVENPHTTILAHLTNRLLLKREGFPVDYKAVIDACAAYGVVIEINSNPWRLELDWRWIDYALSQGVLISINPDAHDTASIQNMYYGVCVARKGGAEARNTLNAYSAAEISRHFQNRNSNR